MSGNPSGRRPWRPADRDLGDGTVRPDGAHVDASLPI